MQWARFGIVFGLHLIGILFAMLNGYGLHPSEILLFRSAQELDLGFVDQPLFVPLLGFFSRSFFGLNVLPLLILSALLHAVACCLNADSVRLLGGGRPGEWFAFLGTLGTPAFLAAGGQFSPLIFELVTFCAVLNLIIAQEEAVIPTTWLTIGIIAGFGCLARTQTMFVMAALFALYLIVSKRDWRGVLIAVFITAVFCAPFLVWNSAHEWVSLKVLPPTAADSELLSDTFLKQFYLVGPVVATLGLLLAGRMVVGAYRPIFGAIAGLWLLSMVSLLLGWIRPEDTAIAWVGIILMAAVGVEQFGGRWSKFTIKTAMVVFCMISVVLVLPIVSPNTLVKNNLQFWNPGQLDRIGSPQFAERVWRSAWGNRTATVLASTPWQASAIQTYSRAKLYVWNGQPQYELWKSPAKFEARVIAVGFTKSQLLTMYGNVSVVGSFDTPFGIDNSLNGTSIYVCQSPKYSNVRARLALLK